MAGQVNAVSSGDKANVSPYVNTNFADYLPKNSMAKARLLYVFDIDGSKSIDEKEKEGLKLVLESGGREQWDIYDENNRWVGYVIDGSKPDGRREWYEYAKINENEQRDYYTRVNIYTGEEVFIKYHYDENSEWAERYHNKNLDGNINVEYTGPNNNLPKKMTEVKALYKQTEELLKDADGEIIFDDETGEPKRVEELVGYQTVITEFEYDENFNLVGVPKETRETSLIQNKPKKSLNIKG